MNGHFSAMVLYSSNYVETPEFGQKGGSLPPGLLLNEATGEISGTPTSIGVWNVDVGLRDVTKGTCNAPGSTDMFTSSETYEITIYSSIEE